MTPREIDSILDGYIESQSVSRDEGVTEEELADLMERYPDVPPEG